MTGLVVLKYWNTLKITGFPFVTNGKLIYFRMSQYVSTLQCFC